MFSLCWCSCTKNGPTVSCRWSRSRVFRRERGSAVGLLGHAPTILLAQIEGEKGSKEAVHRGSGMHLHCWIHPSCSLPAPIPTLVHPPLRPDSHTGLPALAGGQQFLDAHRKALAFLLMLRQCATLHTARACFTGALHRLPLAEHMLCWCQGPLGHR